MWPYTFLINTFKALCWMQIYSFPHVLCCFHSTIKSFMNMNNILPALFALLRPFASGKQDFKNWAKLCSLHYFIISGCPTWDNLDQIFTLLSTGYLLYYTKFSKLPCWRRGWCPWHSKKPKWWNKIAKNQFFPTTKELCHPFQNVQ